MVAKLRLKVQVLDRYRRLTGLKTDTALAARMGIDPGNLSRVLQGKQQPGPKFIARLCAAFDAELAELWEVVDVDESDEDEQ